MDGNVEEFLAGSPFAVAGASADRSKYGNKVFRAYLQANITAIPINPRVDEIEGIKAVQRLEDISDELHGLSIVTPPAITDFIVDAAIAKGIQHIWLQPGAESAAAIQKATDAGVNLLHSGPCILVALKYRE